MSRTVKTDFKPDPNRFRKKVMLAKGFRTFKDFAAEAGVNSSYLSKAISNKAYVSCTTSFSWGIARAAENGITYEELMVAAGYEPSNHPSKKFSTKQGDIIKREYERGLLEGYNRARVDVFKVITNNPDAVTICKALFAFEPEYSPNMLSDDAAYNEMPALAPGLVVRKKFTYAQYVILSVLSPEMAIVLSSSGKIKTMSVQKMVYVGVHLSDEIASELLKAFSTDISV